MSDEIWTDEEFERRKLAYLSDIAPMVRERVKLRLLASPVKITVGPAAGDLKYEMPSDIQAIDDKLVEMIRGLQRLYFGVTL